MSFVDIVAPLDSQEGTKMMVQTWLKQQGSAVVAFEPLVELETDKVTMEIEAPADGIVAEILIEIGVEVEPGMVLGRISTKTETASVVDPQVTKETSKETQQDDPVNQTARHEANVNKVLSPVVRRFVIANKLDTTQIVGSGKKGRITLQDVKQYLVSSTPLSTPSSDQVPEPASNKSVPKAQPIDGTTRVEHTGMRRAIAKHMHDSVTMAPHVTAVFEADFSAISEHRASHKAEFASRGVKLTYTAYMVAACVEAMKVVPEVNSQWHEDFIDIYSDINIGIGTALGDKGLIVPVIPKTQEMSLFGIASHLQGSIERARENKLKPDDVRGGTFTISNHGISGSLFATPIIINQPQSAILGVGKLEKRAIVKSLDGQDTIAIRPMAYVSLTIDHRVLDGHQTNTWLTTFVHTLENWKN